MDAKPNENENVHDWGESDLAWELADAISPLLAERDRHQLYATIGSGDSYDAIDTMLQTMAQDSFPVSAKLVAKPRYLARRLRAQPGCTPPTPTAAYRHSIELMSHFKELGLVQ